MNDAPSFSAARKWSLTLNVLVALAAVLALLLMVNYLAARHFKRLEWSARARAQLSPLTQRVLGALTNEIKVTIYFDRDEAIYESVWGLLKEYKFANSRIVVETVDYNRDPGAANLIKARYKLTSTQDKNIVIFDAGGRVKIVEQKQLSELDYSALTSGQGREVRRTHFRGEMEFTSAILNVTTARALKAYFLQGHGEHRPDSDETLMGYSKFAGVLRENNVLFDPLNLAGSGDVPADCQLLIIAGPVNPLLPEELEKIGRYLKQGGRLLALLNFYSVNKTTGLEQILAQWGVTVGNNVVFDRENSVTGQDMVVSQFGGHAISRPFLQSRLYLVLPRSVAKTQTSGAGADAPQVDPLATTSENGRVLTDVRGGVATPAPGDYIGTVPLMAAVEKGGIRGVSADRGATRLVVVGESIFLGNETIDKVANRDFASHAVNWLLARNEMLVGLGPRPIKEYKLTMTTGDLASVRWILLLGMPGAVLLLGLIVWARRRN